MLNKYLVLFLHHWEVHFLGCTQVFQQRQAKGCLYCDTLALGWVGLLATGNGALVSYPPGFTSIRELLTLIVALEMWETSPGPSSTTVWLGLSSQFQEDNAFNLKCNRMLELVYMVTIN